MKKRVLFITTQFPYPLNNGGKKGALNGINVLNNGEYHIDVLSFSEEENKVIEEGMNIYKKELPNVSFIFPVIHDIHIRKKPLKLFSAFARDFIMKTPYIVTKFYKKEMIKNIDECFRKNKYEFLFIDYLNMSFYGDYIMSKYPEKIKKVFFKDHNIEFELVKQEFEKSKGLKRLILKREIKLTQNYEINRIKQADICFSVCEDNTKFLKLYNKKSYTMLPTYASKKFRKKIENKNRIVFVGNLSWKSNMQGLIWFVNYCMPLINKTIPDAKLYVAGSGLAANPFNNNNNVIFLGYVSDLSGFYDDKSIFIVPLFEGSGIRIKILDAFNEDIAVVSTTIGCNTICCENRKEIMVADDSEQFAGYVIELLLNNELNNKIRYNAKQFLINKYSLESIQKYIMKVIDDEMEMSNLK